MVFKTIYFETEKYIRKNNKTKINKNSNTRFYLLFFRIYSRNMYTYLYARLLYILPRKKCFTQSNNLFLRFELKNYCSSDFQFINIKRF